MNPIRVLIVDDHKMVRDGLRYFMSDEPGIHVAGDADSLKNMFAVLKTQTIDVILMDFKLRDGDGINGALKVRDLFKHIKVILITAHIEPEIIHSALQSKLDAIIFKSIDELDLIETIKSVYQGTFNALENLPKKYAKEDSNLIQMVDFTRKEQQVLDWIALGRTNSEIGSEMNIAEKTVRNYLHAIYRKIHVSNRTEAAAYWIKSRMSNRDK